MKPSEICEQAADLIEERGWTRNQVQSPAGELCTYGALRIATYGNADLDTTWDSPYGVACEAVMRILPAGGVITTWNDTIAGNKDEVIEVLRNAAKDLSNDNQ